jgi:hypothetical protein
MSYAHGSDVEGYSGFRPKESLKRNSPFRISIIRLAPVNLSTNAERIVIHPIQITSFLFCFCFPHLLDFAFAHR